MNVPLVDELDVVPDPVHCCEQLEGLPYRLFLDSAARGTRLGRYSFLTADPVAVVRSKAARTECLDPATGIAPVDSGDALAAIETLLAPHAADPVAGLPPFQGGAAGFLAYDWGRVLERLPAPRHDDLALPDVVLGLYDWVLAWDHDAGRAWLISTGMPETSPSARARRAAGRLAAVRRRLADQVVRRSTVIVPAPDTLSGAADRRGDPAPSYPVEGGWWDPRLELRSSFTHAAYLDAAARVREYVFAGDIFQANLSQRFEAPLGEPAWALYRRLRTQNAAPFAAFLEFPGAAVISASPERFLHVDVAGRVETRPIKGTRPRGVGPEHDGALGQALTESAKDRAENLMIVDLMRNDLSRVCAPGTVRVPELFALERYPTVHHLVSTVVGDLAPGRTALDALRLAFPGGSITGAPKVRAMEIIAELEPSERSVYCGSIGYWSVTGALDTSIVIRTAIARRGRVYFSAGGGIVADSDPEQEYRETLDKARAMIDALVVPA
ncbi:MAG: aminodeoxychorismate synthase component I [Acidobacteriota bacterium]